MGTEIEILHEFTLETAGELTLFLTTDFFAVATLFGPSALDSNGNPVAGYGIYEGYSYIDDTSDFTDQGLFRAFPLDRGSYLLALTQVPNYFNPELPGFERTGDYFTRTFGCEFVDEFDCTGKAEGTYSGSLTVQAVPEPATLTLLALGASVVWCRRRHAHLGARTRHRPSS